MIVHYIRTYLIYCTSMGMLLSSGSESGPWAALLHKLEQCGANQVPEPVHDPATTPEIPLEEVGQNREGIRMLELSHGQRTRLDSVPSPIRFQLELHPNPAHGVSFSTKIGNEHATNLYSHNYMFLSI